MPEDFKNRLERALAETSGLEPMRRAFRSVLDRQEANRDRIGDLEERRERLARVREECVGDPALLELALSNLEANRFRVRRAADAAEAVAAVVSEMAGERLLVKSKTNLAKEIDLANALGEAGIEVVETDIADRILQVSGLPSVHPTGPCAQLTRYDIAGILSEHLGRDIEPEPEALIEALREDIRPYIDRAMVGLTGVNAIAAAEGAVLMVHNEGNLDLVSQRPGKLVMLAGLEKVYPDLEEALNMAKLETYYATGQPVTSFIRIIGGPSKTADIEKQLFYGIHGPSEVVLILVDNGRSELLEQVRSASALRCIGCGACLLECPVYDVVGPLFGSPGHLGGTGVCARGRGGEGIGAALESGLLLCTTCGLCAERCPVSIDAPALVEELRSRASAQGLLPSPEHEPMIASIRDYSNPWMLPRRTRGHWAKGLAATGREGASALFFAGCSLALLYPEVAAASVRVLEAVGVEPSSLGSEEVCCGSPLKRLGETGLFERTARENADRIIETGAEEVIVACPGCLKALRDYGERFVDFDVRVRHISEVLFEAVSSGKLRLEAPRAMTVTWHDPCHLGRGCGVYDEPRGVLRAIEGLDLVEIERSHEFSICCGSGGGVKTAFGGLSLEIGARRMAEAASLGVDAIVTCCPWCEKNLSEAVEGGPGGPRVVDLVTLVAECLDAKG